MGPGGSAPPEPSLPPKFTDIKAILDEDVSVGSFVNVVGVVKDWRLPMPTSRAGELHLFAVSIRSRFSITLTLTH
jgi:hypothetical protein